MKKNIYVWILVILFTPSIFILLISYLIHDFLRLEIKNAILLFDLSSGMTIAEYLGIYAALMGAEVTVFLSFVIYELGERKEKSELKEKKDNAKLFLYDEASFYWTKIGEYVSKWYIKNNNDILNAKLETGLFEISEMWKEKIVFVKKDLPKQDYECLFDYFMDVKCLLLDKDLTKFLKKYTVSFWMNGLSKKEMHEIDGFELLQSYDLYSSFKRLVGEDVIKRSCNYKNKHQFYIEKDQGCRYLVYALDHKKIYDFNFKSKSGFATNYVNDEIGTQGEFVDGKQISGISNNASCDEEGNYLRDWSGGSGTQVDEKTYKKNKNFHKTQADFEIIDNKYVRKSEIRYINRYL